jgi:predicted phosphoribosyltransferase
MICPMTPDPLEAVSLFYHDFGPTSDEEVRALLVEARRRQGTGNWEPRTG